MSRKTVEFRETILRTIFSYAMEARRKKALREFGDYLAGQKMRLTVPRKIILQSVLGYSSHFHAEDLVERLREGGDRVSRGSIYRTLGVLEQAGLIRKVRAGKAGVRYETVYGSGHHDHMICESCGRIIEFFSPEIEQLQNKACREKKFHAAGHSLQIFGFCRECRGKPAGE